MIATGEDSHRKLLIGIALAFLLAGAAVVADLARGGRPDPPVLREASTLLDGSWRFRTGDGLRWADPRLDDRGWETLDLTARPGSHDGDVGLPDYVNGWMAHGHPGYTGYAWYRRAVDVPLVPASWDILGPTLVEDGYELYWNGRLLGGSGQLGPKPRVVGTRPLRFALPPDAAGARGVVALRVFALPADVSPTGGGLHTPPILAPRPVGKELHRGQWERTIAGYVADAVEPLAMLALVGLALWASTRSDRKRFFVFASVALALTAARRFSNALVAWTDLMDLPTYAGLATFMWMPAMAAWTLAWNGWSGRPWRAVDVAALAILTLELVGVATRSTAVTSFARFASIALIVIIGARIARGGPMRILAPAVVALIAAAFFGAELLDPFGVPGIWFPFGIGVSRTQYVYALFVPLFAFLVARAAGTADDRDVRADRSAHALPEPEQARSSQSERPHSGCGL